MKILMSDSKRGFFIDLIASVPDRTSLLILIITNFVCNNIFLFSLKYYGDDWPVFVYPVPKSISFPLLDSQRPLASAYLILQRYLTYDVLLFHLLAFVTTTIALVLIYFIFKRIFSDFGFENEFPALVGALIFCTLFNKDEIYAWPVMSLGFEFIAILLSIFLYLNREKKYYLGLSVIMYFSALLGYEVGVFVPVFFFLYDYGTGKDWKKSLYFALPLVLYLAIRYTNWFGYGWVDVDRGFGSWDMGTILNAVQYPIITGHVFLNNLINSVYGYAQMGGALIAFLCIINIVLLGIIYRHLTALTIGTYSAVKTGFVAISMIVVFFAPYMLAKWNYLPTRGFYLCDTGIALLLVSILIVVGRYVDIRKLAVLVIVIGLFVNQGLFYNWVVSGDIVKKIDHYIQGNPDELARYDYVYFNTTSFNDIKPRIFLKRIPYVPIFDETQTGSIPPPVLTSDRRYDYGFAAYFNAQALPRAALTAMINEQRKENYTLIYGHVHSSQQNEPVPIAVTRDTITYERPGDGTISMVSRDRVFEINYSSVIAFDRSFSVQ
jgi:hypothetical protein